MAQHTYDNEAVQELLNWAKKMIETKNYPTERYQVNKCTTIIDEMCIRDRCHYGYAGDL